MRRLTNDSRKGKPLNGKVQRNDTEEWFKDGKLHREDGPAFISPKHTSWYIEGVCHRDDGPAHVYKVSSGKETKEWHQHGKWHREDGPAIIYSDGRKEYFINNRRIPIGSLELKLIQAKEAKKNIRLKKEAQEG